MRRVRGATALLATSFLLLAGVRPALGQDPPRSAAARDEYAKLARALRKEAIDRAVKSIAERLDRIEPAKARLVRSVAPGDDFATHHLEASLDATLDDLFTRELADGTLAREDLKVDFDLSKNWKSTYRIFKVGAKEVPTDVTGFAPTRTTGYLPEVAAIDNAAPHSMHDLWDYVANRFTHAALQEVIDSKKVIEVHVGTDADALADLHNRGWNVFGEVRAQKHMYLAESPAGEVHYVITDDVDSLDRLRHFTSLLRFSGEDGRGIPAEQVEIVGSVERVKERRRDAFRRAFERLAREGDTAIVGYRSTLRGELTERALAQGGARFLRDTLGDDPKAGLTERLQAERRAAPADRQAALDALLAAVGADRALAKGLKATPASVFKTSSVFQSFLAAEKRLVALALEHPGSAVLASLVADGKVRLPGGASTIDYVATRTLPGGDLKADELLVDTPAGRKSVLLLAYNWGDGAGDIVSGLLQVGRRKIAYLGTAGGLDAEARIGDVHIPATIAGADGAPVAGAINAFLAYFDRVASALRTRLKLGTTLAHVFSPAEETMAWLDATRGDGAHAVEVENAHMAAEVAAFNATAARGDEAQLFTALTISDVPGSALTLGNSNGSTARTRDLMVDHFLDALGIDNVVLRRASGARGALTRDARLERELDVARRLIPRAASSTVLRDRIARRLGALDDATLATVPGTAKLSVSDIPGLSPELRAELQADVAAPFTDKEAAASLEKANAVVSRLARALAERHPRAAYELRLGGGIEEGAFSPARGVQLEIAGSAVVKASARALLDEILPAVEGAPPVLLGPAPGGIALGRGSVFAEEPAPLVRLNAERALDTKGVVFRGSGIEYAGREHLALPVTPAPAVVAPTSPADLTRARDALLGRDGAAGPSRTAGMGRLVEERLGETERGER